MPHRTLIIGQGLAGSVLAWQAAWRGDELIVVDAGNSNTASAVAAGLVMPLSGQRLVSRPDFPALLAAAEACYRRIEQETGQTLFRSRMIERRFVSATERQHWEDRVASQQVPPESRFAPRNVHPALPHPKTSNQHPPNPNPPLVTPSSGEAPAEPPHSARGRDAAQQELRLPGASSGQNAVARGPLATTGDPVAGCMLQPRSGPFGALLMPGWQLNVPLLLQVTRDQLLAAHQFLQRPFDAAHVEFHGDGVRVAEIGLEADRIFFCEGHRGRSNCWFPGQPDQPVRGELLRVRLQRPLSADVVVGQVWAAPVPGTEAVAEYLIGATWDRERLEEGLVTAAGRTELLEGLGTLLDLPPASTEQDAPAPPSGVRPLSSGRCDPATLNQHAEVLAQTSGIRAGTRQRQVLVRLHATHPQLGMLNGLGSWGSLTAPAAATALLDLQQESQRSDGEPAGGAPAAAAEAAPARPQSSRRSLTKLAHSMARRAYREGDRVLDATAGNGHDTAFLVALAGPAAVTAIDIQPQAIAATRKRLGPAADDVLLLVGDHAAVLEQQCRDARGSAADDSPAYGVIMFNLGYLPGSDRRVVTQAATTRRALQAGLQLLRPRGVLTAIVYRGHPGGAAEYAAVQQLAATFPDLRVDVVPGDVADETSPVLFAFRAAAVIHS